jgi:hypothetical protein
MGDLTQLSSIKLDSKETYYRENGGMREVKDNYKMKNELPDSTLTSPSLRCACAA